jgi:hypothetical protein
MRAHTLAIRTSTCFYPYYHYYDLLLLTTTVASTSQCPTNGLAEMAACGKGSYSEAGATSCASCAIGYFCPSDATSVDDMYVYYKCPAGMLCPGAVAVTPTLQTHACPPGKYCPLGFPIAQVCAGGSYNPTMGAKSQLDCLACPPGFMCASGCTLSAVEIAITSKFPHSLKCYSTFLLLYDLNH